MSTTTESTKQDQAPSSYFQAVGQIYGEVDFDPKSDKIVVYIDGGGRENKKYAYPLTANKFRLAAIAKRIKKEKELGTGAWKTYLQVYPQSRLDSEAKKVHVFFSCIAWSPTPFKEGKEGTSVFVTNEFILRGEWQFIPQASKPVLTIRRNKGALQGDNDAVRNQHLPVAKIDFSPYRFNPRAENPEKVFLQLKANFSPQKGIFFLSSYLELPESKPPRYEKKETQGKSKERNVTASRTSAPGNTNKRGASPVKPITKNKAKSLADKVTIC